MSELLKINVNEHTEKKNGLTYLSWAWAWAEVLKIDPKASWRLDELAPSQPVFFFPDGSAMVSVTVTIKGDEKGAVLPVMNHRNQAIKNPDAFAINTAIQRCLAKAIAMHGLGLYIYAGEDLPEGDEAPKPEPKKERTGVMADVLATLPPLSPEDAQYFDELAADVEEAFKNSGQAEAFDRVEIEQLDNEQKIHLASRLGSKVRTALKVEKGLRIGAA